MDDNFENCPLKVSVRIRPGETNDSILRKNDDNKFIAVGNKAFLFDTIFDESTNQKAVYDETVKPIVQKVLSGFSCTVLAYGQTGTGKTYTMIGNQKTTYEAGGLISRALDDIFSEINSRNEESNVVLDVSFIEIYNQKIYDLLRPTRNNQSEWTIKSSKIEPDVYQEVKMAAEAQELLNFGMRHRHVGDTKLNSKSSRSHAIFTLRCTIKSANSIKISKLNLVDLAGSESIKRTGNEGVARIEGIHINQSLLTLRQVLIALSKNEKLIPFRESLLTTVLHDSLKVKNYIILMACISANSEDYFETLSTLRFAESTKEFKCKPEIEVLQQFKEYNLTSAMDRIHPTPTKRKLNYTISTPLLPPKRVPMKVNNTYSPLSTVATNKRSLQASLPKKSKLSNITERQISSPELGLDFDGNLSTSTVLETIERISPIEKIQKTNNNKETTGDINQGRYSTRTLKNVPATPLESLKTYPDSWAFIMETIDRKVEQMVELRLKEYTSRRENLIASNSIMESAVPRKLFHNAIDEQAEDGFKIPQVKPPKKKVLRSSLRLSIKVDKENIIPQTTRKKKPPQKYTPPTNNTVHLKSLRSTTKKKKYTNEKDGTPERPTGAQYKRQILEVMNEGSMSDLQKLATIGCKTASLIIRHRSIKGPVDSLEAIQQMPIWRGKQFERFLEANLL